METEKQEVVEQEKQEVTETVTKKKKNKNVFIIVGLLLVIICAVVVVIVIKNGNKNTSSETESDAPQKYSSVYRLSGNGLEDFDLYFLKLENEEKNKIYSPLSIKYALAMLNEGTKGDSHSQIEALIGDYKPKAYTNTKNMSLANAFFVKDTFKDAVNKDFIDTLDKKFSAEVFYDTFKNPDNMNKWISDKTNNQLNNFFDDVANQDYMLVNALAIDMEWVNKIQSLSEEYNILFKHEEFFNYVGELETSGYLSSTFNDSKNDDYKYVKIAATANKYDIVKTLGEDNIRNTVSKEYKEWLDEGVCGDAKDFPTVEEYMNDYMKEINSNYGHFSGSTDFTFYDDDTIKVFEKELKKYNDTTLEYIAVMPKKESLQSYIKDIDAKKLSETISKLKPIELASFEDNYVTKLTGQIPMFKYDSELSLIDDLKSLGVTDVFDSKKADLSKLAKGSYIDTAMHKANIEFSNDGIKAAAATALGGKGAADCRFDHLYEVPVKEIDLSFNKPFMYIVRDKNTGEVWFVGSVYEVSKTSDSDYLSYEY